VIDGLDPAVRFVPHVGAALAADRAGEQRLKIGAFSTRRSPTPSNAFTMTA